MGYTVSWRLRSSSCLSLHRNTVHLQSWSYCSKWSWDGEFISTRTTKICHICFNLLFFVAENNVLFVVHNVYSNEVVDLIMLESLLSSLNWTTIFLSVVSLLAYGWYRNVCRPVGFPPGPVALPIVGNILGKVPFLICLLIQCMFFF